MKQNTPVSLFKLIAQTILATAALAAVLFLAAGRTDWLMAWVFLGMYLVCLVITVFLITPSNPELMAERAEYRPRAGVKRWGTITSILFRLSFLAAILIPGLDVRFGWTKLMPLGWSMLALAIGLLGYGLVVWVMATNRFATVYARIQTERGHAVVTAGPYQFVRHPFYVGVITLMLALPIALGSLWALILAGCGTLLLITKTALEDRLLQAELDGYREYAARVRYRLLPGLW